MSLYQKLFGRVKDTATSLRLRARLAALDLARGISQGTPPQDHVDLGAKVAKMVVDGLGTMGEVPSSAPPPGYRVMSDGEKKAYADNFEPMPLIDSPAKAKFEQKASPDWLEEFERCGTCNHTKQAHRGGLEGCSGFVSTPDEKPNDPTSRIYIERDGRGEEVVAEAIKLAIRTIENGMWHRDEDDERCSYCDALVPYGLARSHTDHHVLCDGIARIYSLRKAEEQALELRANVERLQKQVDAHDSTLATITRWHGMLALGTDALTSFQKIRIDELLESNTKLLFKLRETDRKTIVREFHAKFDCAIGERPHVPADDRVRFRMKLISEEYVEAMRATYGDSKQEPWRFERMVEAIAFVVEKCPVQVDLCEWADAMIDLPWVCEGSLIEFGIDSTPLWTEVAKTNMAKEKAGPGEKIRKPDGWVAPDMAGLLKAQDWNGKDGIER